MKKSTALLCCLLALAGAAFGRAATPGPFGAFSFGLDKRPAQEQVDVLTRLGYQGIMAHTWGEDPLSALRAYADVAAVKAGDFKVFAILWTPSTAATYDAKWLDDVLVEAAKLKSSLWVAGPKAEPLEQTLVFLRQVAARCAQHGVPLVLYPHYKHNFETAEEALALLRRLNVPSVKLSLHVCHEVKAGNEARFEEVIAEVAPYLALVSVSGADTAAAREDKGWSKSIMPLDEGNLDLRPFVAALARNGYTGPVLLHTFGITQKPEEHLARSLRRWQEWNRPTSSGRERTAHDFSVWETEVSAYERSDRASPPPRNGILFVGSSGIRLWKTLAKDFPGRPVINRGVGGSEIVDATHFADRIIFPYAPKMILMRAGNNDLANGKPVGEVFEDFKEFVATIHAKLPATKIAFISINNTTARLKQAEKENTLNRLVEAFARETPGVTYIDAGSAMLDADGKPRPELLADDHLHFSAKGYEVLKERVRPYLP
jgi:lysophospholipase L1-like esterase